VRPLPARKPSHYTPAPSFEIVAETESYAVVNKPPFLLVHPTKPDGPRTLWGELRQLLAFEIETGGQISIINRLDRETSGLVLVAKTSVAARRFGLLMQQNRIGKEYRAIVWGWPDWDNLIVDKPLGRIGAWRPSAVWLKQGVVPNGPPAETTLHVEKRWKRNGDGNFSLVRAIPRTGRTHQIRVHLAEAGFPIVGDKIYGPNDRLYLEFIETGWTPQLEKQLLLPRQALHSCRLRVEGEGDWGSSLPPDLAEFCGQ
jgi:23S rRNA pseudouridine1911/1915/1917 synthase